MLSDNKIKTLTTLLAESNQEERLWISGFVSGFIATQSSHISADNKLELPSKVTMVYGTETGNAKKLANDLSAEFRKKGLKIKVVALDQYRLTDLSKEEHFFVIISTQGEGEPPAAAQAFFDFIHQTSDQFIKLKYSVLALGDSSYPQFCQAGIDVDHQLEKIGGQRLLPVQLCDTDYENLAKEWLVQVMLVLQSNASSLTTTTIATNSPKSVGKQHYTGQVISHINLNDEGSAKETYHIEIAANDLVYEPGDAIGIIPKNEPNLVYASLKALGLEALTRIVYREEAYDLEKLLTEKLNITQLSDRVIKAYAQLIGTDIEIKKPNLVTLLTSYPTHNKEQALEFISLLEANAPRLYSVASSPEAHEGEVHLTVSLNRFNLNGTLKTGLCSGYFAALKEGDEFSFYVHKNHQFKLPIDDAPVIMIGPGTGIAPFRSFLAHREAIGATGKNWLFFGEQHYATDFLYQTEIQAWIEAGVLTHLDVAFSRDQLEKCYVQHKIRAKAATFYQWIEKGAYIYICGAKSPMSEDVEQAILEIIASQKSISLEEANETLLQLKEAGRYNKDVY